MTAADLKRVYWDWNNVTTHPGLYPAVWRLPSGRRDGLAVDYPRPEVGERVAIGEGEDWFLGEVVNTALRADGYGTALVTSPMESPRLDIKESN
jgi:hypothetical protein